MKGFINRSLCLLVLLGLGLFASGGEARADETGRPGWWDRAQAQAKEGGYGLITTPELKELYDKGRNFLVLDVRPDYEFQAGHLPRSLNLEFHLGDRSRLSQAKREVLLSLLGPDRERVIVIYCRSYA
ncbi:MAG: rhodanese-like domain-containing protein [Chlorobiales bacterium]|nr:rhodanese-like domain-containing protein [Chlorobiales bacterium]